MAQNIKLDFRCYNGRPDGIRTIRDNSSLVRAYIIPRAFLSEAKNDVIPENACSGIYYLISADRTKMYVGKTANGISRIQTHNQQKDFWSTAIMFLADNESFHASFISSMEVYAIKKAKECGRYTVLNEVEPKHKIGDDISAVEKNYEMIKFFMAVLDFNLEPKEAVPQNSFHTTRNGVKANGVYLEGKFKVLAGSVVDMSRPAISDSIEAVRKKAVEEKEVVKQKDGSYVLMKNKEFSSCSYAATFILGGSNNGWTEWKNDEGLTLDEVYRKKN